MNPSHIEWRIIVVKTRARVVGAKRGILLYDEFEPLPLAAVVLTTRNAKHSHALTFTQCGSM